MLTVACVLRSGGDYRPEHVSLLRRSVEEHLVQEHKFVCLTDAPIVDAERLPLRHGWPGWWSKMELFDGRLEPPVLYLDLDTIVTGPLDPIARGHSFTMLRNFLRPGRVGSGLMAWSENLSTIFRQFALRPGKIIQQYRSATRWGDQAFIRDFSPVTPDLWQLRHPGKVASFKVDCVPAGRVPPGVAVVCFHGKPRPWNMSVPQREWFGIGSNESSVHGPLGLASSGEERASSHPLHAR